jgi:hypothetical protein
MAYHDELGELLNNLSNNSITQEEFKIAKSELLIKYSLGDTSVPQQNKSLHTEATQGYSSGKTTPQFKNPIGMIIPAPQAEINRLKVKLRSYQAISIVSIIVSIALALMSFAPSLFSKEELPNATNKSAGVEEIQSQDPNAKGILGFTIEEPTPVSITRVNKIALTGNTDLSRTYGIDESSLTNWSIIDEDNALGFCAPFDQNIKRNSSDLHFYFTLEDKWYEIKAQIDLEGHDCEQNINYPNSYKSFGFHLPPEYDRRKIDVIMFESSYVLLSIMGYGGSLMDERQIGSENYLSDETINQKFISVVRGFIGGKVSDENILVLGNQACNAFDAGYSIEDVLNDPSTDSLATGGAAFIIVSSAATDLCTKHIEKFWEHANRFEG